MYLILPKLLPSDHAYITVAPYYNCPSVDESRMFKWSHCRLHSACADTGQGSIQGYQGQAGRGLQVRGVQCILAAKLGRSGRPIYPIRQSQRSHLSRPSDAPWFLQGPQVKLMGANGRRHLQPAFDSYCLAFLVILTFVAILLEGLVLLRQVLH